MARIYTDVALKQFPFLVLAQTPNHGDDLPVTLDPLATIDTIDEPVWQEYDPEDLELLLVATLGDTLDYQ